MSLFKNLLIIAKGKAIKLNKDINDKAIDARRVIAENKAEPRIMITENKTEAVPSQQKNAQSKLPERDPKVYDILLDLSEYYKSDSHILSELDTLTDEDLLCIDKVGYLEWKSRNNQY